VLRHLPIKISNKPNLNEDGMEGFDDESELSAAELMEFCNQVHLIPMNKNRHKSY
jgi:SPX domain protein involved in polyphosphate accumulation